jgi:CYTH domain-containing protein
VFRCRSDPLGGRQGIALRQSHIGENRKVQLPPKYARIERERRFLLERFPTAENVKRTLQLADRYIDGTALRLREQREQGGPTVYKLTQKVPVRASGAQQGFITTMYITKDEFSVLAQLWAKTLSKSRHSVPPFGIDVFEGALEGLVLAEAEFDTPDAAAALTLPSFIYREVSADERFTGGKLVRTSRRDLQILLHEYGIDTSTPGNGGTL